MLDVLRKARTRRAVLVMVAAAVLGPAAAGAQTQPRLVVFEGFYRPT